MKTKKVISPKQLPTRLPILLGCVLWLMLDRYAAPGWAWGVAGTIWGVLVLGFVVNLFTDRYTEIEELK